ncbi:hypothetical protein [Caballeronia catudaia]|uniref:hypothetical protein n=1 Tax=Caballeronia catudaia TaxID=1777136 RepID=UPI000A783C63|nr:hypothetical protein [Caballeronia catudaia]
MHQLQTQKRHLRANLHPFDTLKWLFCAHDGIVALRLNLNKPERNPEHSGQQQ